MLSYIEEVGAYIKKYAPFYDICVFSPIIAQFYLESAGGTSDKVVRKDSKGNVIEMLHNHAGLKYNPKTPNRCPTACGHFSENGFEERSDGSTYNKVMEWLIFPSLEACVIGYFDFLKNGWGRYDNLKGVTDPEQYLTLIRQDGYATDSNYVSKLMNVINKYNLTQYDKKEGESMLIAIDAGHGSDTAGKRTPDAYREHWANVKVASFFAAAMDRCNVKYIKTGWNDDNSKDDADISLSKRQSQIKSAQCDYSISFHFNACGDGKTYNSGEGIETLIHSSYPGDSLNLANAIQKYLIQGTEQKNRGVKKQALSMCNCKTMGTKASVLIECAFMTNKREAELMKSDAFCRECAEEAAKGFCEYAGVQYIADTAKKETKPVANESPYIVGTQKECPFKVKTKEPLNIRKSPNGFISAENGASGIFTIVEVSGSWGLLKAYKSNRNGWISISSKYVERA